MAGWKMNNIGKVHIYSADDLKAGRADSKLMSDLKKPRSDRDPLYGGGALLMPREVSSFDGVKLPNIPTGDFEDFGKFLDEAFGRAMSTRKGTGPAAEAVGKKTMGDDVEEVIRRNAIEMLKAGKSIPDVLSILNVR